MDSKKSNKKLFIIGGAALIIYLIMSTQKTFAALTANQQFRKADNWGSGAFGASRGTRKHAGIDIVVYPGQAINAPVSGIIKRIAYPYEDDTDYKGFVLTAGDYEIKIFYANLTVPIGTKVTAGMKIAEAQNIAAKYSGMTNHVHFEVRKNGVLINPTNLF